MAQKFYTTKEAAELLGIAPADLNSMRERNEIRGFRDGMDWKFRAEDVEALRLKLRADATAGGAHHTPGSDDEILLLDEDLTPGNVGTSGSGTIAGGLSGIDAGKSDVKVAGSGVKLGGSGIGAQATPEGPSERDSLFDELEPLPPATAESLEAGPAVGGNAGCLGIARGVYGLPPAIAVGQNSIQCRAESPVRAAGRALWPASRDTGGAPDHGCGD